MQEFQQRVIEEKRDLDIKIDSLDDFFNSSIYHSLGNKEQSRLSDQFVAMKQYSNIMGKRIGAF